MMPVRSILCFLILSGFMTLQAQTAPDFSVTDSKGKSHTLFADYLNQGKTVVLEVFFTTCPPCNSLAPHLEPLYQSWGGGNADVEFIALSILQSDTDNKVNAYLNNHNTTFPGVGGEGGSVNAVAPYRDGTFGTYTGTPLFVVIAPDKSVNYDVFGSGIQGQIDALDAAIEATGATGMVTAVENPELTLPLVMTSNIVTEKITFTYAGEPTKLTATAVNMNGQVYTSATFPIENENPVTMNIAGMPAGSWVMHVKDHKTNATKSFMFIKQ